MKYTPGPWHFAYDGPSLPIVCTDKAVIALVRNGEKYDGSEIEANARLIAAAPELLEACRGAIAHLISGDLTEAMTLKRLREAIAKAEGRDA